MSLSQSVSSYWNNIQKSLFPHLEEVCDAPFSERLLKLITILDMVKIEQFVPSLRGYVGRPQKSRLAIARAFIAKVVFDIPTTVLLIDRLRSDKNLRRICGFESIFQVPSESSFSRAFRDFAELQIAAKAHQALVTSTYKDEIIGHVSIDSIESREKVVKKKEPSVRKHGKQTRINRQASGKMSLDEMLKDLPCTCDIGRKKNSNNHSYTWIGYKLHLAVNDNGIPLAAILTSASMNDSQAAIPLMNITKERVVNLYDVMDSQYYAKGIIDYSKSLGHVPIIDVAAKGKEQKKAKEREKLARQKLNWKPAEAIRYHIRTSIERANARLKDEFGALNIRVKRAKKVFAHLMYGILAQTADQLLKLVT